MQDFAGFCSVKMHGQLPLQAEIFALLLVQVTAALDRVPKIRPRAIQIQANLLLPLPRFLRPCKHLQNSAPLNLEVGITGSCTEQMEHKEHKCAESAEAHGPPEWATGPPGPARTRRHPHITWKA
mmetsp:Transcript_138532/g.196095  ORF Transcript_138532/g.196095 Transcript_138532/m.196095 type:complete len:125 (-) Transcript_138532:21-395(-)